MLKALEILKHKWINGNVVFDEKHNKHIRYIKYSEELINKAIEELEALQNRSCNNCKYNKDEVCCNDNSLLCADFVNENFCCNKWESK